MNNNIIMIIFFSVFTLALFIPGFYFLNKINKIRKKEPVALKNYSKEMVIGIMSGGVILVVDRVITIFFSSIKKIDFTTFDIYSFLNITFTILISVGTIFFGVSLLLYRGISHLDKKESIYNLRKGMK